MKGIKYILCICVYCISLLIPLAFQAYSIGEFLCISFFSLVLVAGATIDMQYYILPDEGAIGLAIVGIYYGYITNHLLSDTWVNLSVMVVVLMGLWYISHQGIGWGDIKWLCAISLWLTTYQIIVMFYIAVLSALLYLFIQKTINTNISTYIPFGPFIAFGGWNGLHFSHFWEDLYWSIVMSIDVAALFS